MNTRQDQDRYGSTAAALLIAAALTAAVALLAALAIFAAPQTSDPVPAGAPGPLVVTVTPTTHHAATTAPAPDTAAMHADHLHHLEHLRQLHADHEHHLTHLHYEAANP